MSVFNKSDLKSIYLNMFDGNLPGSNVKQMSDNLSMVAYVENVDVAEGDTPTVVDLALERNVARISVGWNTDGNNRDKTVITEGPNKGDSFKVISTFIAYARPTGSIVNDATTINDDNNVENFLYGPYDATVMSKNIQQGEIAIGNHRDYYSRTIADGDHMAMAGSLSNGNWADGAMPGESYFYVFPNKPYDNNPKNLGTYIVLEVEYTRKNSKKADLVYYTIEVNGLNTGGSPYGVLANTAYNIFVNIDRKGAKDPFTSNKAGTIMAKVSVKAWNVVWQLSQY